MHQHRRSSMYRMEFVKAGYDRRAMLLSGNNSRALRKSALFELWPVLLFWMRKKDVVHAVERDDARERGFCAAMG